MVSRTPALFLTLLAFLFYGVRHGWCSCSNVTALSARLDALLAEYERATPPAAAVRVRMALDVRHATIVEPTDTMRLLADLHMSWQDNRLTWNASEWGCDWALGSAERLWVPDVTLANAAASTDADQPLSARVASTGAVAYTTRLDVSIPIAMDLSDWPSDVQTGVFKFASRAHGIDEISIGVKEGGESTVFESGAWAIVGVSQEVSTLASAVAGGEERSAAVWRLALRRRAPGQALAARAALASALLLLAAAALTPPATRAPLAAAAALIVALWLCGAAWRLGGGGGAGAPRSVRVLGAVLGAAGAAGAAAGLAARLARNTAPPPHLLRSTVAAASALLKFAPPQQCAEGGESGWWLAAARLLDALLLGLLALVLFVLLCIYL